MKKNPVKTAIKGTISIEGGAKPKPHEIPTAEALADAGYTVRFIPAHDSNRSADIYINNTIFEIKAPEGKTVSCIEHNIKKALNHQSANIVIDSMRMKNIRDRSIQNFLLGRLRLKHGIQRLIFVGRDRKVVDVNSLL